jgi:phage-related protein (TIGR01555 family)
MPKPKKKIIDGFRTWASDGWENIYTGIGTALDKITGHRPNKESWLDEETLEAIYETDPIAQRIIVELPNNAFRNGWSPIFNGADDDAEKIHDEANAIVEILDGDEYNQGLGATKFLIEAIYWGRLYGRGGLLIGVDDGRDVSQPIDVEKITDIKFLEPLYSREFYAETYYDDPTERNYGLPKTWRVQRQVGSQMSESMEVHESRIIITWSNIPTSRRRKSEESWRSQPTLQPLYEKLRAYSSSQMSIANMITDASIAVLKVVGLRELMSTEDLTSFTNRMRILNMGRGIRVLPIDEEETYEYIERKFTGLPDVIDRQQAGLAADSGYPQVLLFGKGAPGLANEEISSDRNWNGNVKSSQLLWKKCLIRLVRLAALVTGARDPDKWTVEMNSVWERTPEEEADSKKKTAETDKIYIDSDVLLPEEVAIKRFGSGAFDDGAPQIDIEARQSLIESDLERMKEDPTEPEPEQPTEMEPEPEQPTEMEPEPEQPTEMEPEIEKNNE